MKKQVVILGGGIAGLASAWMLARSGEYSVTLIERAPTTGGICATFRHGEFLLDYGPHKCYSAIPGVLDELRNLVGDEFIEHEKKNSIFMFGTHLRYPVGISDLVTHMGFADAFRCGTSAALSSFHQLWPGDEPKSYEDYVVARFGRGIYELVFRPLADKIWGEPSTLSADIARTRIPSASAIDVLSRALGIKSDTALTDAKTFFYPRQGFGRIGERMEEEIQKHGGTVLTSTVPTRIQHSERVVTAVDVTNGLKSTTIPCDLLVSTLPLDHLLGLLGGASDSDSAEALDAAKNLQYRGAFLVYVFLKKDMVTENHWTFFPESDVIFGRVSEQKRMSPEMAPHDRTVLCCDFTGETGGALATQSDHELASKCITDLERIGMIKSCWVEGHLVKRLSRFYPRYDLHYRTTITAVYTSLKRYDRLLSTGRIGFYNYNNSDHCVDMARTIAEGLAAGHPTNTIWNDLESRVGAYRIID